MPSLKPRVKKLISRRTLLRASLPTLLAGSAGTVLESTYWLSIEEKTIRLPKWDASGFRAAVLADLHVDTEQDVSLTQRAVEAAIQARPDVILFLGDYTSNATPHQLGLLARALQALAWADCPCYGILGNHDYAFGAGKPTAKALKEANVRLLLDESAEVRGVTLLGFKDGINGRPNYSAFDPLRTSRSAIALLHEPDFVEFAPAWPSIQLSGHSHGGQVCLPFGVPLVKAYGASRFVAGGLYLNARVPLYLSRGIGTRKVNFRLFCRPELSILTLRVA